jgi:sugar-specific transcriptional regulator TrmB
MLEELYAKLALMGLSKKEASIYVACLQSETGKFTVDLVADTKYKRSTIDVIVKSLISQGLLSYHLDGQRKRYSATDPNALIESFESVTKELKQLLPLVYAPTKKNGPKIRFYEGAESVLRMFDDIFLTIKMGKRKEREMLAIAAIEDMNKAVGGIQEKMQVRRLSNHISLRIISPKDTLSEALHKSDLSDKKTLREMKFFDGKKFPFHVSFNVYEDSVSIFKLTGSPSGVILEDSSLAESLRSLFELLWEKLN